MPRQEITMPDTAEFIDAIRDHLSPEAVALIAAKCQPVYARGEAGRAAEQECAWFAQQLVAVLGQQEYDAVAEKLKI